MSHTCNLCGETCAFRRIDRDGGGLLDCTVIGGYDSTAGNGFGALDDCSSYGFSLCEFCLDWLFTQMKHPPITIPCVDGKTEPFRSAAQRVREDDWRTSKDEFFAEWNRRNEIRGVR